ncbi:hypothetical protein phiAS5_ORF0310 [Aeromonas phage phiAS5]|uniref:Uncharacterized protein n=1 Tax=Aeromonas phage phiAS5 TaxID=879630 RepID=E1A264_9CAUD|nr:hypothetical protein phiAS5_ORF0310 [Aeromonas phage phiAS5]ADM80153.1 hypothetical protein phiAS5_ORF0310 [Aeromonas phage phiAS5]UYD60227.1 hypothetical protein OPFAMLBM_00214 [Aeromonas phage avDM12-TAAL]BES53086.1 hypothetical protein [Aeromonas phage phiWae14]
MIFLAKIRYMKSEYMGSSKSFDTIKLVEAEDADEADSKVREYYNDKSSDYGTYYSVLDVSIEEPIR